MRPPSLYKLDAVAVLPATCWCACAVLRVTWRIALPCRGQRYFSDAGIVHFND